VAYHACCHLQRELGVDRQPRTLLASLDGIEQTALVGDDECCGFGGLFAIKNAGISEAMGRTKTQNIVSSGADLVALCDVSCMTHINGLLSRQGQSARAVHITQLLTGEASGAVSPPPTAPSSGSGGSAPPSPAGSTPAAPTPRRWQDVK
jgi:L-lactate dehydrogenase complex protein LldE